MLCTTEIIIFIIWKPLKITLCPPCRLFRCTLTNIPQTQALLNKAKLPLGLLLHPFKDLSVWQIFQPLNAEISTVPSLESRAGQRIIKEEQVWPRKIPLVTDISLLQADHCHVSGFFSLPVLSFEAPLHQKLQQLRGSTALGLWHKAAHLIA